MPSKHRVKITVDGKSYWVGGKTENEARIRAEIRRNELEQGVRTIRKTMQVKDWAEEWVSTYKEDVINSNNVRDYRSIIKIYINPAIGHYRVQDVRAHDINKILQKASESKSSAHVKRIRETCMQIFREAYASDLTTVDVEKGVKRYKGSPPVQRRALTSQERELTIITAKTHYGGLFVLIMLYAGLRPGEVSALKWNHIDLKRRIINVKEAVKTTGEIGEPKSKAGKRTVPIVAPLYERLINEKKIFQSLCMYRCERQQIQ